MQCGKDDIFFWYCLNTIVCKFNNFNTGIVNAIQKKFAKFHEMGKQIKSALLLTLWTVLTLFNAINAILFQLSFACYPALHFNIGHKLLWNISFSSTCSCYYRKHPNNDVIRFIRYYLQLVSNSTFITDSQYLDTVQIWQNLNEHHHYLTST